jgi:hypothetical protein
MIRAHEIWRPAKSVEITRDPSGSFCILQPNDVQSLRPAHGLLAHRLTPAGTTPDDEGERMKLAARNDSLPQPEAEERHVSKSDVVPRAIVRPEALSYHLLRPREAGPADVPLLGEAYRCWSEVWHDTFAQLENRLCVPSDDFTRQDEVGALFQGYECIGLSFYRWVDLSSPIIRDDSYFSVWPEETRDAACAKGSRICVSSNFTIGPSWRRAEGCSLKDVLGALVVERFLVSDSTTLVGTMRADRGMSRLTDRLGFRRLREGVIHHGVEVDLVAFFRDSCARAPNTPVDEEIVQALRPHGVNS